MKWERISISEGEKPEDILLMYIRRSGYFRLKDQEKKELLKEKYHKGYELRIGCYEDEIEKISLICEKMSVKPGKPYKKVNKWVFPIYGFKNIQTISKLISG
jgi:hypothetical protein